MTESASIARLRAQLAAEDGPVVCELAPGVHVLDRALLVGRSGVELRGHPTEPTVLCRAPGFIGSLVACRGCADVSVRDLSIDGRARGAAEARPFHPDVSISAAERVTLRRVHCSDAVRCAVGIGRSTRGALLEDVRVVAAGEYGVWMGAAFAAQLPLPLPAKDARLLPTDVRLTGCELRDCGASGVYVEARDVVLVDCRLVGNHARFPFGVDGGQVEIDYRAHGVELLRCAVLDGPALTRDGKDLRAVGLEIYGSGVVLRETTVEGNAHEGLFLNGARDVVVEASSRIAGNQTARAKPRPDVAITTTPELAARNAVARDITFDGVTLDRGVLVWTTGSAAPLLDRLRVRGCRLLHTREPVVVAAAEDGATLRGAQWRIRGNRAVS